MKNPTKKVEKRNRIEDVLDLWQIKRRDRLAFILELLKSEKEVDVNEFLGLMGTKYGIRRQTSKEYLKDWVDYGVIEISDGKIKWLGKKESKKEG